MASKVYAIIEPFLNECEIGSKLSRIDISGHKTLHILLRDEKMGDIDFKKTVEDLLEKYNGEYPVVIRHLVDDHGFSRPKIESYGEDRTSEI